MKNKPMCKICARNAATYRFRDVCHPCVDKIAKVYFTIKKHNSPVPPGMPNIQNIQDTDKLLDKLHNVPLSPADAEAINAPYWLHWSACDHAGHLGLKTIEGNCWFCEQGEDQIALHLSPRQEAVAAGESWYTPDDPCPYCGTIAPKHVHNGMCKGCKPNKAARPKSPRQAAIAAGESWYTPSTPCPHCDTISLRHTNNGRCQGCQPVKRKTPTATHVNTLPADTIISRDDADLLEMRYYRTGNYCRKGHNGFRLTSTGACVDCMQRPTC